MIGETISHYRILEKLGEGGMGVVCETGTTHSRGVGPNLLPASATSSQKRQAPPIQEPVATATREHPSVTSMFGVGAEDGHTFVATSLSEENAL